MAATPTSRSRLVSIVVDTREQRPYEFDPAHFVTVRRALPVGDYSLEGHEAQVAIERKSLDDFVSTVIGQRERFGRELRVLRGYELGCVVVEGSLEDILAQRYRSRAHPNSVLGAALSIIVDYRVPVFFCGDRQLAVHFAAGLLGRYARKMAG